MTMPDGNQVDIHMFTTVATDGETHVNQYPTHQDVFTRVKK